jgi:fatty acid desaturase
MNARISLNDYEAVERDLFVARARTIWRRHALVFAAAISLWILVALGLGGFTWLGLLVVSLWAVVLAVHYNGRVRHSDERIRAQQGRVEWRAGRSSEHLVPRV